MVSKKKNIYKELQKPDIVNDPSLPSEISRIVIAEQIKHDPFELLINATQGERHALSVRFNLNKIIDLKASLIITHLKSKSVIEVNGIYHAHLVQNCVVTLEPFEEQVEGKFRCKYSEEVNENVDQIIDFVISSEDPCEPIIDGKFDVGIILSEEFGIGLDPFPRAPGISLVKSKYIMVKT